MDPTNGTSVFCPECNLEARAPAYLVDAVVACPHCGCQYRVSTVQSEASQPPASASTPEKMLRMARRQRALLQALCVSIALSVGVGMAIAVFSETPRHRSPSSAFVLLLVLWIVSCFITHIYFLLLSTEVRLAWVWGVLTALDALVALAGRVHEGALCLGYVLVPLSLIAVLVVNGKATGHLRDAGFMVGLLGVSKRQLSMPLPANAQALAHVKTEWAVASLICGLAGLIVWPLAILALAFGVVALVHIKKDPERHGGKKMATAGVILGSLIGLFLLFLLFAIVLDL